MYKESKINNRRYLGNKYKLLPFIKGVVDRECRDVNSFADIFAGTGAVSSAFSDKIIITNDILFSNYVCNYAFFSPERYNKKKIIELITYYNSLNINEENHMTENFSNTFFDFPNCSKIGFIREDIENKEREGEINFREKSLLLTSLQYAMDKIAKTCGHYDAYRKNTVYNEKLELYVPNASNENNEENRCYNIDANDLVREINVDLVYIDPPYNSRQYCDAYHLLENVSRWEKKEVFGIAKKMDRKALKSKYCTKDAPSSFKDLIENINSRYILLSYNNSENKRNDRSNAKISDEDIFETLERKGDVKVFSENYKEFTTGKTEKIGNKERLFLCECY